MEIPLMLIGVLTAQGEYNPPQPLTAKNTSQQRTGWIPQLSYSHSENSYTEKTHLYWIGLCTKLPPYTCAVVIDLIHKSHNAPVP